MSDETNISAVSLTWDNDAEMWDAQVEIVGECEYWAQAETAEKAMERLFDLMNRFPVGKANHVVSAPAMESEAPESPESTASAVEAAAKRTLALMPQSKPGEPSGDVILTVTIVALVIKLVVVAYNFWKDKHKTADIVWNPNLLQRFYLRRVVRKVLAKHGQLDKLNDVMTALLQMAKASTLEDIQAIFDEARSDPKIWVAATEFGLL